MEIVRGQQQTRHQWQSLWASRHIDPRTLLKSHRLATAAGLRLSFCRRLCLRTSVNLHLKLPGLLFGCNDDSHIFIGNRPQDTRVHQSCNSLPSLLLFIHHLVVGGGSQWRLLLFGLDASAGSRGGRRAQAHRLLVLQIPRCRWSFKGEGGDGGRDIDTGLVLWLWMLFFFARATCAPVCVFVALPFCVEKVEEATIKKRRQLGTSRGTWTCTSP